MNLEPLSHEPKQNRSASLLFEPCPRSDGSWELMIARERVQLLPERALYWPRTQTLILADPDFGKTEILTNSSVEFWLPLLQADLARLSGLIQLYSVQRILILGELWNLPLPWPTSATQAFKTWRTQHRLAITWVAPNPLAQLPSLAEELGIEGVWDQLREGPFLFAASHRYPEGPTAYAWCAQGRPLARPFKISALVGNLPSFSAGGHPSPSALMGAPGDQLYWAPEGRVQEFLPLEQGGDSVIHSEC